MPHKLKNQSYRNYLFDEKDLAIYPIYPTWVLGGAQSRLAHGVPAPSTSPHISLNYSYSWPPTPGEPPFSPPTKSEVIPSCPPCQWWNLPSKRSNRSRIIPNSKKEVSTCVNLKFKTFWSSSSSHLSWCHFFQVLYPMQSLVSVIRTFPLDLMRLKSRWRNSHGTNAPLFPSFH